MKKRMIALALSATMVLSAGVMLAGCSGDPDTNRIRMKKKMFRSCFGDLHSSRRWRRK